MLRSLGPLTCALFHLIDRISLSDGGRWRDEASRARVGRLAARLALRRALQRILQHLARVVHRNECHLGAQFRRQVIQVELVALGDDDRADARAVGRERLLLQPADGQHLATQG